MHVLEMPRLEELRGGTTSPARLADWEATLIGESPLMRRIRHIIGLVGPRRASVLITGETGTGKEIAARAIHLASGRAGSMVAVNCTALPDNLLEAELFGHVRGAFTGAFQTRVGRIEHAHGGTLFLDEIGDLPLELQAKLLRVLQEREFQRIGSSETVKVDVRVVAATNTDLQRRIAENRFREDLYYRLNVVPIEMPPLRERPEDVRALAEHFLEKVCSLERIPLRRLTEDAVEQLCASSWPGNVRQLQNAVEMAIALSGERIQLSSTDFPMPPRPETGGWPDPITIDLPACGLDYERTIATFERNILQQALKRTGGNKKAAADMLRLKRTTLSAKMRSLESAVLRS